MNMYKKSNILYIIEYMINLKFLPKMLIGGDFNICHKLFKPSIGLALQKAILVKQAKCLGLDYIKKPGILIYYTEYIIDYIFFNILFAMNTIRYDLNNGLNYFIIITTILEIKTVDSR